MNSRLRGLVDRIRMRTAARVVVPIAIVVILGSLVTRPPSPPDSTESPNPSQVAHASPSTGPTTPPAPTPTAEPWEQLTLDPAVVVAALAPERIGPAGVGTTARFTIKSLNGDPVQELAAGVRAEPPIEFRVIGGATADEAILEPTTALLEGTTYLLILETGNGALGGSWAFRTDRPLHVVGTLPGDLTTGVPVETGIEVTFDQDGSTGVETRFHIEPSVPGRFEQHGRTWAFVPTQRLANATAYRVTIDPGVRLQGSDQVLEAAVTFRFETAATTSGPEWEVSFAGPMAAIKPSERPVLPLYGYVEDDEFEVAVPAPDELAVRIFRLPTLAAALDAAETLTGPDSWLRVSGGGLVETAGLVKVADVMAALQLDRDSVYFLDVPVRLDPGAYLVETSGGAGPAQLLLQVRVMAAYVVSSETDVVAWVNDLATVTPIAGAHVALRDGRVLGATNAAGVARFTTPAALRPDASDGWNPRPSVISITGPDGRWIVAGLGTRSSQFHGGHEGFWSGSPEARSRWWMLFNTDRSQYRQTDVVHVWGLLRARDGDTVPADVELRLRPYESESAAAIERIVVHPNARGVFVADMPLRDLPRRGYMIDLLVDGVVVEGRWIDVAEIRKPSFSIEVETDEHVFLDGDPIDVRIQASFFDGSTVPRMDLRVHSEPSGFTTTVTTDATGAARATVPARFEGESRSGMSSQSISVTPVRPEEGEISGGTHVTVFPSRAWLVAEATLTGTSLVVNGTLSHVDFAGMNASYEPIDWWSPDWDTIAGGPLAGRPVSAVVTHHRQVRTALEQHYDFIEKRVVTTYGYDVVNTRVGTYGTTSGANGQFRIQVTVPSTTDAYSVSLTSSDADGRTVVESASAYARINPQAAQQPSFLISGSCGPAGITVGLDAAATVTMHDGDGRVASDGSFLFIVANRGIREASVSDASTFSRQLTVDDLPGFTIRGVQVTGAGYTTADAGVYVDVNDLAIDVQLRPDRPRYAPGDRVSVKITTLGPDGRPIAADVILQGVDEKLYAIGAAYDTDVLRELHVPTGSGFMQSFTSHRIPARLDDGGCGAEGGAREAFGDVVTFQLIKTGPDGRATASFDLLDDLTSWRVTALALAGGVRAGNASTLIPVGLPFFVEAVLAPEYLVGDLPVLRVRGYGDALDAGDVVRFSVSSSSLGLAETVVEGLAFEASRVALPALPAGNHRIRIEATGPGGRTDTLIRTIHVVPTRLAAIVTRSELLTAGFAPQGGDGLTSYTILDAGRGALLSNLQTLADAQSARFDRGAAAEMARRILIDEYGFAPANLPSTGFDAARYEQFGIALLPYASRDPELTALAALTVPALINAESAGDYLRSLIEDGQPTSEFHAIALAGLAGLGEDVLSELQALAGEDRSTRGSLWIAIGLAAVGDENGARAIERELLEAHGQRFGPWVRLGVGANIEDTIDAARLLLVLSSRLGDPIARDVRRYLADHPSSERSIALEELAYIQASLARLPREAGRVAWSVDGERHEVELRPGGGFTLTLTAAQRATLVLQPLAGKLAVVTSWTGTQADVPKGGPVTIARVVTPGSNAPEDLLVRVRFTVAFTGGASTGCWQITDLAPSGLVPVDRRWEWPDGDSRSGSGVGSPYQVDGQRVFFCAYTDSPTRVFEYVARVVSPGTYTWEPAVIQSVDAPELGVSVAGFRYTIR